MLPKANRAGTKEVDRLFKEAKSISSSILTFKYLKNNQKQVIISFIVPKSVAKQAVSRSLLRRRGYSALAKHLHLFPAGIIGAFIFKRYQEDITILSDEIKKILSEIY